MSLWNMQRVYRGLFNHRFFRGGHKLINAEEGEAPVVLGRKSKMVASKRQSEQMASMLIKGDTFEGSKVKKREFVPEECQVCYGEVMPMCVGDAMFQIPSKAFGGTKHQNDRQGCPRCVRHHLIYGNNWPDKSMDGLVKLLDKFGMDMDKVMEKQKSKIYQDYGVKVPGMSIPDGTKPYVVWVFPGDEHFANNTDDILWWPGIVIPREFCDLESSLKKVAWGLNDDDVVMMYFEGPSVYVKTNPYV